jgi:outer membrane protein assembly factor BamB
MTITFWNGHPLHGGQQIAGEVTHEADGTLTFRSHEGGTYRDVYVRNENGNTTEVWLAQRSKISA